MSEMMRFLQPTPAEVLCVTGARGSGKTTWAKSYLSRIPRVVAWDPLGEFAELLGERVHLDRLAAHPHKDSAVLRLSVDPGPWGVEEGDLEERFGLFCRTVEGIGNLCAVVEEVSLVASPNRVPPPFARLAAIGRHSGVSLVVIGQRFAQFPRVLTAQASRIVALRQVEPSDLADLDKRIGELGDRKASDVARSLGVGQLIDWTPTEGARICA